VHTPEFSFEHDIDHVRWATKERAIHYPWTIAPSFVRSRTEDDGG
jgi:hypothetical protein